MDDASTMTMMVMMMMMMMMMMMVMMRGKPTDDSIDGNHQKNHILGGKMELLAHE